MSRLRNRLVAEGRIERVLSRELWVMPEYADNQEDDQDGDGDRRSDETGLGTSTQRESSGSLTRRRVQCNREYGGESAAHAVVARSGLSLQDRS